MLDLSNKDNRKYLLDQTDPLKSSFEKTRIEQSVYETEIYSGKIYKYVKKYLNEKYDKSTVDEMSIVSTVNMAKRIANQEASLYKDAPDRTFSGVDDATPIKDLYSLMKVDQKLLRSNRLFRMQLQSAIYVKVKKGKIELVPLKHHHYRVYEDADGELYYLIPNLRHVHGKGTDFEEKKRARYTVWSEKYNFIMDGHGEIVGEDDYLENPLGIIPIIDVSGEKDDCYFVDSYRGLAEFTIQFNAALCDLWHVMRMQGFSIMLLTGPKHLIELVTQVNVGVGKLVRLPTEVDRDGNVVECKLDFVNASPDLAGSIQVIETLLSAFLSSEGVDGAVTLTSNNDSFNSGWERLLALIEKFNATKEDISIYQEVERQIFFILQKIMEVYANNSPKVLNDDYIVQGLKDVTISVEHKEPEMIETQAEKETRAYERESKGVASKVDTVMTVYRFKDRDKAVLKLNEIEKDKLQFSSENENKPDDNEKEDDEEDELENVG